MFTLDAKNSDLLKQTRKFMHSEQKFEFLEFLDKCLKIQVEIDGSVNMMLISQPDRTIDEDMSADLFEVVISNFKVENPANGKYRIITNNFRKTYDRPSSEELEHCHNYEKEFCESRIVDLKAM